MCLPKEFLPVCRGRSTAVFYRMGWQILSSLGDAQSCALPTGLSSGIRKYALPRGAGCLQPRKQSRRVGDWTLWGGPAVCPAGPGGPSLQT